MHQITLTRLLNKAIEPPPAFSPEYNPIEKLWRNTKKEATHLKYFKTFDELRASVLNVFRKYLDEATHVIHMMKRNYALRPVLPEKPAKVFF